MLKRILIPILATVILFTSSCELAIDKELPDPCDDFILIHIGEQDLCVSPDYYMVDGIRTPVGMAEARRIAAENNAFLPTPDIVDAIWEQADIRLDPIPMRPGPQMTSREYYVRHNEMIEEQLSGMNTEGLLIAGHKKDIVQQMRNGRVTIYGWHRSDGNPIQPASSVHGSEYFDYSHGLRLVRFPN